MRDNSIGKRFKIILKFGNLNTNMEIMIFISFYYRNNLLYFADIIMVYFIYAIKIGKLEGTIQTYFIWTSMLFRAKISVVFDPSPTLSSAVLPL